MQFFIANGVAANDPLVSYVPSHLQDFSPPPPTLPFKPSFDFGLFFFVDYVFSEFRMSMAMKSVEAAAIFL